MIASAAIANAPTTIVLGNACLVDLARLTEGDGSDECNLAPLWEVQRI